MSNLYDEHDVTFSFDEPTGYIPNPNPDEDEWEDEEDEDYEEDERYNGNEQLE